MGYNGGACKDCIRPGFYRLGDACKPCPKTAYAAMALVVLALCAWGLSTQSLPQVSPPPAALIP